MDYEKSICLKAVFYLVAKTCIGLRAVWNTNFTCPWHFVLENKSILYAIQPECLCLNHSNCSTKCYKEGPT